ncbi:MAG TPA: DinB family protein, partial [Myxococcaceae bacterium]|nr:DinB family protein [Myxococcaceae bacterium]
MKRSAEAWRLLGPKTEGDAKRLLADGLAETRARTLGLIAPLPDTELARQHSPLMSPIVWDLAHVANYEEQWLLRALGAA